MGACTHGAASISVDGLRASHAEVELTWFAPSTFINLCFGAGEACTAHLTISPHASLEVGVVAATCAVSGLDSIRQTTAVMACELTMTQVSGRWIGSFRGTVSAAGTPSRELAGAFDACPGGATE